MIDYAEGRIGRTVAIRLSPGEDLYKGIERVCEECGIRHGVILSGIGSVAVAKFCDPVELPDTKAGYGYSDPIVKEGAIELISMSGSICEGADGIASLHIHSCYADGEGNTFAGHLVEGNPILMTADIVIAEFEGIRMDRRMDEELGVPIVRPKKG